MTKLSEIDSVGDGLSTRLEDVVPDSPRTIRAREEAEKNGLDYHVKETIGQGRKHRTEKWVDKKTGEVVVARSSSTLDIDHGEFLRQAKRLLSLNHPATSKAVGFIPQTRDKPATLLTACEACTLGDLLACPEKFTSTHRAKVLVGVAAAIKYLHERKHVHGSLKPSKIGIDTEGNPQVLLGVQIMAGNLDDAWRAPEALLDGKVVEAGDVYALGLLAYLLITDRPVYDPQLKPFPLAQAIVTGQRPTPPEGISEAIANLITRAWDVNPEARPTAGEFFEVLSENGYKIRPDVDELVVRKYAARFVDGAQPGETRDAAESRILAQTREELQDQGRVIAGLQQRINVLAFENLQLAKSGAAVDRAIEVLASKILELERTIAELKRGRESA